MRRNKTASPGAEKEMWVTITLPRPSLRSVITDKMAEWGGCAELLRQGISSHTLYGIRDCDLGRFPTTATIRQLATATGLSEAEVVLGLCEVVGINLPRST